VFAEMSRHSVFGFSLRLASGLAALVLTAAAVLYEPIALSSQSSAGMDLRTHLLLVVVVISATGTWILTIRPNRRASRFVSSVAGGFNGVWIFSGIGLPVVVASLIAIFVAAIGLPRRVAAVVVALALVGLGLGLIAVRLTQPPGEHIFG
jgi:presenilin-like A22 family membrane protease